MDTHPLQRLLDRAFDRNVIDIYTHGIAQQGEFRATFLHVLVAVPTRIRGGNTRTWRLIHGAVAISAVDPKLIRMQIMIIRDRLIWLVAYPLRFRGGIVREGCSQPCYYTYEACRYLKRQQVGPSRKKISHVVTRVLMLVKDFTSKNFRKNLTGPKVERGSIFQWVLTIRPPCIDE